ncbi:MAG TPA: 16S rRNA (cytidine(1402)-2'-O)-methyltransferase [Halanaerobiaceae bacterium]|jgi:16S rRNA (cytidine1402-2'-O)-methyltransferase|nr:16S rRNA (cytidine(1402)-2'-O)-methyltransferase [Bacillota bacterium]HHU92171.1 16S rRNA (cytidine(1402)-2'-O)-methyltransferase [Halanaerobiaceae bacterium]HOA41586.1 16S rRNA (cytidine(1402)-2'-O)-methyltransferase [Halanaerobiales bacterium]HPZ63727.1 16S rRNA (cytidine(1402)-2'-O)-methyltransferase [Halanaerobiales bacterium]HQD04973.1 16S rRNA (cytidine(1402)-2'-O)-methyltransferase [Halanaerobiales bacterium]
MSEKKNYVQGGTLYVCGTPIGNLDDMTFRAIQVLKEVDLIAAEDTRRTIKLLNYFEIKNQLESYHEHNEEEKAEKLLQLMQEGKAIALVSDAGMPGISDPGYKLVKKAIEQGIEVVPVPGPTAAISALVVSGLDTSRFAFEGFLSRKGRAREEELEKLRSEERTIIIYESPYRVQATLKDLERVLGDRRIALVRELTKLHEEKYYGKISSLLEELKGQEVKGEIVIIVEGKQPGEGLETAAWAELEIEEHVRLLMAEGLSKKEAIKRVAEIRAIPKREVYQEAIGIDFGK